VSNVCSYNANHMALPAAMLGNNPGERTTAVSTQGPFEPHQDDSHMATARFRTLGSAIATRRKELGLSQDALASRVARVGGKQLLPQDLNGLEHDRVDPRDETLVKNIAIELKLNKSELWQLARAFKAAHANSDVLAERFRSRMLAYRRKQDLR
jgi:transcriptional regulator with XRE-family HTH domain